jgi:5-amino-6-(5-phosphoribosylamino)uracil reductase
VSLLRLLLPGSAVVGDLDDERADVVQALADLYSYPTPLPTSGWVRANMVSTLDGSASGGDGLSGTIGGAADRMVFRVLRGLADVVVVGAGTARSEGYHLPEPAPDFAERRAKAGQAPAPVLALVTRSGRLPEANDLFTGDVVSGGGTLVVTCTAADVDGLRARLGSDRVVVAGEDDVDPVIAVAQLAARGLRRVLLEGGPRLLGRFESSSRLDELCLTTSPLVVAGDGPRIAHDTDPDGRPRSVTLRMRAAHLVECDGLLLGRWLVQAS